MYAPKSRVGPYVLVQKLGQGGFAPVWLAKEMYGETELRSAAVKLFTVDRVAGGARLDPVAAEAHRLRVIEEARVLCHVEHPNVVRFYSMFSDKEHNVLGLAMEYVAGEAVDRLLERRGTLSVPEALALGAAIASALGAIHRSGLVHRDVKPGNVIDASGVYKLIDFGIAAATVRSERPSKPTAVILDNLPLSLARSEMSRLSTGFAGEDTSFDHHFPAGTLGYMDPETVSTRAAPAPASDLYSLGVVLFECLTGKLPAMLAGGEGLSGEVLDGRKPALSLRAALPSAPRALAVLVDKMLAPRRADRPKSAEWVARELERIRSETTAKPRKLPDEDTGPFRALDRFESGDRDVYFGRTMEVAGALELLQSKGFVAVVGPSGSGKSSLARAGIVPAVLDGGLGAWPPAWDVLVASPGADPRAAIAQALARIVPDAASLAPEELVFHLGEHVQTSGRGVFVLLDQLEEMATLASGSSQAWAVEVVVRLGEQMVPGVRTLATARQDLLDALLRIHQLGSTLGRGSLLVVTPFSDAGWMDVVDQALQTYGYALEDDALREKLRAHLQGTANAMPLVQFALTQLWARRDRARKLVTHQGFTGMGGIAGALERHAETTLTRLRDSSDDALDTARQILLALTTTQGTRATLSEEEIARRVPSPLTRAIIERLEHARLFVRGPEGVTLAHEALLTHWRRLQWWVADARQARELADDLERDADRWATDAESVPLMPRARTQTIERLRKGGEINPSQRAAAYLVASARGANRARVWRAVGLGAVVAALAAGAVLWISLQEERSERERSARELLEANTQLGQIKELKTRMSGLDERLASVKRALRGNNLERARNELSGAADESQQVAQGLGKLKAEIHRRLPQGAAPPRTAATSNGGDIDAGAASTVSPGGTEVAATARPSGGSDVPAPNPIAASAPDESAKASDTRAPDGVAGRSEEKMNDTPPPARTAVRQAALQASVGSLSAMCLHSVWRTRRHAVSITLLVHVGAVGVERVAPTRETGMERRGRRPRHPVRERRALARRERRTRGTARHHARARPGRRRPMTHGPSRIAARVHARGRAAILPGGCLTRACSKNEQSCRGAKAEGIRRPRSPGDRLGHPRGTGRPSSARRGPELRHPRADRAGAAERLLPHLLVPRPHGGAQREHRTRRPPPARSQGLSAVAQGARAQGRAVGQRHRLLHRRHVSARQSRDRHRRVERAHVLPGARRAGEDDAASLRDGRGNPPRGPLCRGRPRPHRTEQVLPGRGAGLRLRDLLGGDRPAMDGGAVAEPRTAGRPLALARSRVSVGRRAGNPARLRASAVGRKAAGHGSRRAGAHARRPPTPTRVSLDASSRGAEKIDASRRP